jgi:DNA invertase Pin-like site-specific DNA recombinase
MTIHAAIYARVSTTNQSPENQVAELQAVAGRMGWQVKSIYIDHGVSGTKENTARPAFEDLCKAAARKEYGLVMAWSVDRLGRSLQKLVAFLEDMHAKKIDLYLHKQGIDTTTPSGKAMFQLCSVFAEFEQAMIRDRVLAGLARAKDKGKTLGRPKVSQSIENSILLLRQQGNGIKKIAKQLKVGVSVVQRVISNSYCS